MKLELINKSYQSQDERIQYKINYGRNNASIIVNQLGSGTIYLNGKSAIILLSELQKLIDEVEMGRMDDFNENP